MCQATGSTVTPLDDARLYSWIVNRTVGIVTGCTVTSAGTNQLSIAAGWGVCQGHMFTIAAETISAVLATSGTLPGRLLIHIDTADTDTPVKFVTQAAATLPALTQEDIDGSGSIYEIPLATYTAGTISISGLTSVAPAATSIQSAINALNTALSAKTDFYYSTAAKNGGSIHYQAVSLTFAASEKTTHVTFEASFATKCAGVFTQIESGYTTTNPHIAVTNKTATGCDLVYSANTAFTVVVDLLAIGY